uniref:hypothetical protein n=1 Tax=Aeromonas sp. Ne-1 TaxID=1675689 RepID=UPI00156490AB|nr:hypothetical protein [Aeromonas sp. Ne-1]
MVKVEEEIIFNKLKTVFLTSKEADEMSDLILDLQDYLINQGYLTKELRLTKDSYESESLKEITDIFTKVRNEYQAYNEPCGDFSYLAVAYYWLEAKGIIV